MRWMKESRHYLGVLFDRGERWKLVVYVLVSIFLGILDMASVVVVAPLVVAMGSDWRSGTAETAARILGAETQQQLVTWLLLITIGGFILKDLLAIAFSWWASRFTAEIRARGQIELVEYYLRLPYYKHAHLGMALIMRKTTNTVLQAYSAYASGILAIVSQVFSVICITAALVWSAPLITVILAAFIGIAAFLFLRAVRPVNDRIGRESLSAGQTSYGATFDAFGAIKETQLRHSYPYFLDALSTPTYQMARLQQLSQFLAALPKQLMEILFMIGLGVSFGIAAATGQATNILASLAVLVAGAFRLLPTIAALIGSVTNVRQSREGTREFVEDKLAARATQRARQDGYAVTAPPTPLQSTLAADDIRFRYAESGPEVLKGITLSIPAGSTAAFVGSSGAGKSTLLDIVMGLQTPTSGRLLVDGTDVQTNLAGWQRNIGVVPQEVFLTDRTIAENVAFDCAKEDIDEALVRHALEQADIWDFVESQPEGIWSSFGERGRRLSGGQRQRIGIARALYRQPAVLILDEATSALDNETEARIAETIGALHGQITTIIVAHRLSTVRDADLIAFLADGKVEATGTFAELQERSEGFRHLVDLASLSETDPR